MQQTPQSEPSAFDFEHDICSRPTSNNILPSLDLSSEDSWISEKFEMDKVPIWLDCDPGHDDAFAILFAAHHPHIELLGISTVHGNSSIANTTKNAGSVLTAVGRSNVPVYQGSEKGMSRPAVHAPDIHGESGIEGTDLLPAPAIPAIKDGSTIDAIAKALLMTPPQTAWLVSVGAMTNIGHLLVSHPQVATHVAGLSIMGGAIGSDFTSAPLGKVDDRERYGNYTAFAEFNILCDPEAAALIFTNEVLAAKTVLIPLDVTHQVLATDEVQSLLKGSAETTSNMRTMFLELLNFFATTYADVFGITDGPPLHDPLAVAVILDGIAGVEVPFFDFKEHGKRERYHVEVITDGTHEEALSGMTQTGRTIATLLEPGKEGVKIPRGLDVQRFWKLVGDCMSRADKTNAANAHLYS